MQMRKLKLIALLASLSLALCACGSSPVQPGVVVEAPQVTQPPAPKIVQETPARPTGYYRQKILDALAQP